MSPKTRNIIGWILAGLVTLALIASATMKFTMSGEAAEKGAAAIGLTLGTMKVLGVVELSSAILFFIPRTGLLGLLLVTAYLGGAIATHLEHQQSPIAPMILQSVAWIAATVRFPELSRRLMGRPVTA